MAFTAHAQLTLIVLASLPIIFVIIYFIIHKVFPSFPKLQLALDRINLLMRQRLTGLKVIRAFNRDQLEEDTFDEANKKDRKSTRLNSSHVAISYAVFCLKKKNNNK